MAKVRVLFVVHGLWRAGAETQLVKLVNSLPAGTFEKHIVSYRQGDDLKDDIDTDEVRIHQLDRRWRFDPGVGKAIGRLIDENNIDIVHCTMRNALFFAYMGTRFSMRKPQLVAAVHSTTNASWTLGLGDLFVYRFILKTCSQVWFVSSGQADLWIQRMPFLAENGTTIHNGVDIDVFSPDSALADAHSERASHGIRDDEAVLCCIARFQPVKLHSVLIDAVARVRQAGRSCRLLLAGTGPLEQVLRDQVRALNLEGSVEFLGLRSDVRPVLAASDCMLLVSEAETFSMAMLEAMAMQVPVIMTAVGGAGEAVEDGVTGYLVQPRDTAQLADRITLMLDNPERRIRMGHKAREVVAERFSVTKMVEDSANSLLAVAAKN